MSDLQDTTAANNQEQTPVVKISPIRIITAIGTGATADEANLAGANLFEEQMTDYQDTITGKIVVVSSGCNLLIEDAYSVQYWAMVRIA